MKRALLSLVLLAAASAPPWSLPDWESECDWETGEVVSWKVTNAMLVMVYDLLRGLR